MHCKLKVLWTLRQMLLQLMLKVIFNSSIQLWIITGFFIHDVHVCTYICIFSFDCLLLWICRICIFFKYFISWFDLIVYLASKKGWMNLGLLNICCKSYWALKARRIWSLKCVNESYLLILFLLSHWGIHICLLWKQDVGLNDLLTWLTLVNPMYG